VLFPATRREHFAACGITQLWRAFFRRRGAEENREERRGTFSHSSA